MINSFLPAQCSASAVFAIERYLAVHLAVCHMPIPSVGRKIHRGGKNLLFLT